MKRASQRVVEWFVDNLGRAASICYASLMNTRATSIAEEAERLPDADRIRLIEHLLATLDKPDSEIDEAWADESERRIDAYLRGETTARDAAVVIGKRLKP